MTIYLEFKPEMRALHCWVCGCPFALPEALYLRTKSHDTGFHCPNGHKLGLGESDTARLTRELQQARIESNAWKKSSEACSKDLAELLTKKKQGRQK